MIPSLLVLAIFQRTSGKIKTLCFKALNADGLTMSIGINVPKCSLPHLLKVVWEVKEVDRDLHRPISHKTFELMFLRQETRCSTSLPFSNKHGDFRYQEVTVTLIRGPRLAMIEKFRFTANDLVTERLLIIKSFRGRYSLILNPRVDDNIYPVARPIDFPAAVAELEKLTLPKGCLFLTHQAWNVMVPLSSLPVTFTQQLSKAAFITFYLMGSASHDHKLAEVQFNAWTDRCSKTSEKFVRIVIEELKPNFELWIEFGHYNKSIKPMVKFRISDDLQSFQQYDSFFTSSPPVSLPVANVFRGLTEPTDLPTIVVKNIITEVVYYKALNDAHDVVISKSEQFGMVSFYTGYIMEDVPEHRPIRRYRIVTNSEVCKALKEMSVT